MNNIGNVIASHLGPEDDISRFRARIQFLLDMLPDPVAIMSLDGIIVQANRAWQRNAKRLSTERIQLGDDYLSTLRTIALKGDAGAQILLRKFSEIRSGKRMRFSYTHVGQGIFLDRNFKLDFSGFGRDAHQYVLVTVQDATELRKLKRQTRQLGTRLLHAQEEERRRLARDLHDSTSQLTVGLQLNLMELKRAALPPSTQPILADCFEIVERLQDEIRTLSYLYHPPRLEPGGLKATLEDMITGFARRSDFAVETSLDDIQGASPAIETAIFRLAQEALTNIHRHARAARVQVRLIGRTGYIHLLCEDDGVGLGSGDRSEFPEFGVGIRGMRERVRDLGGRLSIPRVRRGTLLLASLPYCEP